MSQPIFAFAITVILFIAIGGGYMMIKFPERFFGDATSAEAIAEMQDLQMDIAPDPDELTDNFAHNMTLFEADGAEQILSEHDLGIAFIPSRKTYVEFKVGADDDAQYVPGPEYDVIIVKGGNFEFPEPLMYDDLMTEKDFPKLVEKIAARISMVSDGMDVVKAHVEAGYVSDKITRYVVSDEEIGLMHFVTECDKSESCQFELNAKEGMLTVMSAQEFM
ncbi:hypothetical protein HOG48_01710 [Candidatus Peregrinibacteria bacterium]|nr:hypothetical protein [Candidatus Peregrinibacteria bacterium]